MNNRCEKLEKLNNYFGIGEWRVRDRLIVFFVEVVEEISYDFVSGYVDEFECWFV